ncbi:MAG: NHL repeat-containing protein, partial [Flexibacteraceae bacterium]
FVADRLNHVIRKITPAGLVTTIAGTGAPGYVNGTGTSAAFNYPSSVAVDASGNLYVADYYNHRIRKITASGVVTTLAGSGSISFADGTGEAAAFSYPISVAVDASENVYVGDSYNHRVRKITSDGIVTTLAGSGIQDYVDGIGTSAAFNFPYGVAVDTDGNVYVADVSNQRIRKITADGAVTTLAGSGNSGFADGTGIAASFSNAAGLATDASGNVYVADYLNHRIRKITASGVVTTLAGTGTAGNDNGIANTASFRNPYGVAVDAIGNIYAADFSNHLIRKITICYTPSTPTITGNPEICFGGSTVLTSSSATGNLWNTGETTQSITVSTAGEYTVQVIDNVCTSAISEPLEIIVNSLPQASTITGNTTINVGGITVLTSSVADGNLWSNGATTQSITVSTTGTFSVKVISGTCTSATSNIIVVDMNVLDYTVSTLAG